MGVALPASAGLPSVHVDSLKDQWRSYLHQQMAPDFSWVDAEYVAAPSVLSPYRDRVAIQMRSEQRIQVALGQNGSRFNVTFAPASETQRQPLASSLGILSDSRSLLKGEFIASSLEQRLGESGRIALGAVLARQRFASAGMGVFSWDAPARLYGTHVEPTPETATGGGVRVDYSSALRDGMSVNIGLQSKINMEPFKSYRGVYSDPGDFDIPARAEFGLSYQASEFWSFAAGAERVFYSGIDAFTSAALPSRFLSLLGDGNSPVFEWRDLTVYSLEAGLDDGHGGDWSLRYTTQQQPEPTSAILARALAPDYTNTNVALGYRRGMGSFGSLSLAASYAPSTYFLGASPYVQRDLGSGSQVELEAVWSIAF